MSMMLQNAKLVPLDIESQNLETDANYVRPELIAMVAVTLARPALLVVLFL